MWFLLVVPPLALACLLPRFNFANFPALTFEQVDRSVFRNVDHAFHAMAQGGNLPCILNAANEVTVQLFLEDKIGFTDIATLNGLAMESCPFIAQPDLDALLETDAAARRWVKDNARIHI